MNTRKQPLQRIGGVLKSLSDELGLDAGLRRSKLPDVWAAVAGPQISAVSKPVKVEKGKLYVRVANSVWRQELTLLSADLVVRMREQLKDVDIQELILL